MYVAALDSLSALIAAADIMAGSPMSLYDFYMYLKHIEHSPENLEFYVWYVGASGWPLNVTNPS